VVIQLLDDVWERNLVRNVFKVLSDFTTNRIRFVKYIAV
jgi:hypothetical protein